jgi:hypothetical protein
MAIEKQSAADSPLKTLRNGGIHELVDALDAVDTSAVDAEGNTALHAVMYNPALGRSPRLLEAVMMELLQTGADPFAKNKEGQTPRDLANAIREAENVPDVVYGAMSMVVWRLETIEREMGAEEQEKSADTNFTARESTPKIERDSWAQQVLKNRQIHKSLER